MPPSLSTSHASRTNWIYVSIRVRDGERELKPAQIAFDRILFDSPPRLISSRVQVIIRNGDVEQRSMAIVLPHDPEATRIPIRLCGQME
jgi:hypothetical protein